MTVYLVLVALISQGQALQFAIRPNQPTLPRPLLPLPFEKSKILYAALRPRSTKYIPWSLSAATPVGAVLHDRSDASRCCSCSREKRDRKSVLLLNQRKLPKIILKCRDQARKAAELLEAAYPHLSFSREIDTWHESEWSHEQLLDVLHGKQLYDSGARNDIIRTVTLDEILVVDGKSTVATMEVLRKAHNVPAAMRLLCLSVKSVRHNQRVRKQITHDKRLPSIQDNDNDLQEAKADKNELRQVYKAVFSLLGYLNQRQDGSSPRLIMYLLEHHMPNIAKVQPGFEIYHAVINALGKSGACDLIVEMLEDMETYRTPMDPIMPREDNHLIEAEAETLVTMAPPVDRMAYQTAISSLARHGHCREATQLFYRMQSKGFEQPDMNIYNELLIGIAKEAGNQSSIRKNDTEDASVAGGSEHGPSKPWHQVSLEILREIECNTTPTVQTYNSVISTCMKEGEWYAARVVEKAASLSAREATIEMKPAGAEEVFQNRALKRVGSSPNAEQKFGFTYFQNLKLNYKVGKGGKDTWWEIGRYFADDKLETNEDDGKKHYAQAGGIIIGIQPHRNPLSNGLSIVFFDDSRVRLGRILLKNNNLDENRIQVEQRYCSSLVGMEVSKARRGEGFSKAFIAIWLRICLETDSYPRAAVMNKPLIAYVLMGFNFVPQNGGSRVELIRLNENDVSIDRNEDGYDPQFALYSPSAKSLQGLFSQRVLRTQNIAILDHLPSSISQEKRTAIYLKTRFEHPIAILERAVEYNPPSLLKSENTVIAVEGCRGQLPEQTQNTKEKQTHVQRKLLDDQIHTVLKTGNVEGESKSGYLEFFSNSTLLMQAFLPCEQ